MKQGISKCLSPVLMAAGIASCAPGKVPETPVSSTVCEDLSSDETLKNRFERLYRTRKAILESIEGVHKEDKSLYWACADSHQECVARTSLRWFSHIEQAQQNPECKSFLALPTWSIQGGDEEKCYYETYAERGDYPFLIDYLEDANSCGMAVANCIDNLSEIKKSSRLDEAISNANAESGFEADKKTSADAGSFDSFSPRQPKIGDFLGRAVGHYVEDEVCLKKPVVVACFEDVKKLSTMSKEQLAAEFKDEIATCKTNGVRDQELDLPCEQEPVESRREKCRSFVDACLVAALEDVIKR